MNVVSWTKRFWLHAILAACGLAAGTREASAQIGWTPAGEICTAERTVSGVVIEKKTCVRWKPVTQVCMTPEKSVTYRNVCRTGFRPEQFLQCVPKTTYDKVTVDEGCWKMVWCPKPVTKVVPRTTMEQVVRTRKVPYQYVEQVPQVVTRMVPKYTTKYVPETYQTVERVPFHHRLPGKQTVMRPPSCSAPAPTCSAPVSMPMTTYSPPPAAPTCAMPQMQTAMAMPTPAAPTCAMPQQPTCAIPSSGVYPPAVTPTYAPSHGSIYDNGIAPRPYDPGVPTEAAPLNASPADAVPEPMADPQSYYPTQSPNAHAAADDGGPIKSLAALWQE